MFTGGKSSSKFSATFVFKIGSKQSPNLVTLLGMKIEIWKWSFC
jgi:hypothetical protein